MNRAEAATFIGERYGEYLDAIGRTAADSAGNLNAVIDDALRALGYRSTELATADIEADTQEERDYRLQLAYRTIEQVVRSLRATSFRLSVSGDTFDLGKLVDSAEHELNELAALVLARFSTLSVDTGSYSPNVDTPFVAVDLNYFIDDCLEMVG